MHEYVYRPTCTCTCRRSWSISTAAQKSPNTFIENFSCLFVFLLSESSSNLSKIYPLRSEDQIELGIALPFFLPVCYRSSRNHARKLLHCTLLTLMEMIWAVLHVLEDLSCFVFHHIPHSSKFPIKKYYRMGRRISAIWLVNVTVWEFFTDLHAISR